MEKDVPSLFTLSIKKNEHFRNSKKLIRNGYVSDLDKDNNLVNGINIGKDEIFGWGLMKSAFGIKVNHTSAVVGTEYFKGQIPLQKEFDDMGAMMKFIQKQFPL